MKSLKEERLETGALTKYAELEERRLDLEARAKALKDEQAALKDAVLNAFIEQGISRLTVNGRTLYLKRELWAAKKHAADQPEDLVRALHAAGFEDLAMPKTNWASLSALFRERERDGEEPVPDSLSDVFEASEVFKIGSRRS